MAGWKVEITRAVIGAAIEVHRQLGPGMLERAYQRCLAFELRERGLAVQTEVPLDVVYKGLAIPGSYRLDLLVEDRVVVEVKACDPLPPLAQAQLLTYLRFSGRSVGLLLNFHVERLKDGIHRLVL
ncbi:MAG: GxxExxY protein [Alphaproteobacteria bacterium]|nr:GxxExxY protein [Alphaproteobacteria bacterium]